MDTAFSLEHNSGSVFDKVEDRNAITIEKQGEIQSCMRTVLDLKKAMPLAKPRAILDAMVKAFPELDFKEATEMVDVWEDISREIKNVAIAYGDAAAIREAQLVEKVGSLRSFLRARGISEEELGDEHLTSAIIRGDEEKGTPSFWEGFYEWNQRSA